jgi:hypothetical protein
MSNHFETLIHQTEEEINESQIPLIVQGTKLAFALESHARRGGKAFAETQLEGLYRAATVDQPISLRQVSGLLETITAEEKLQGQLKAEYARLFGGEELS